MKFVKKLSKIKQQAANFNWPGAKCRWKSGRANENIGVIFIKLIEYSGKLPSGPVKKK